MRQRLLAILTELIPPYNANRVLDRLLAEMREPTPAQLNAASNVPTTQLVAKAFWQAMIEAIK